MASIVLTGLAANDPMPGVYIEENFAQGPAAGSGSPREVILMGNLLPSGTATANTVIYGPDSPVTLQTEQDCITLFGAGSELHRMFRRFTKVNQTTTLRAIAITQSAGAQATLVLTLTVTATANGTLRVWVGDTSVETAITNGDTPTVIAANAVVNINSITSLPVVASSSSGVLTLTAKQAGLRGNWLRGQALIIVGAGSAIGTLVNGVSSTNDAFFTGGTTADSNVTALGTMLSTRYYRIVSAAEDATQVGAVSAQVALQALPTTGMVERIFVGYVDTISNLITLATGVNASRCEFTWSRGSGWTPAELAAHMAAIVSLNEDVAGPNPKCNFAGFGNDATTQAQWPVPAPRDTTLYPTRPTLVSALNNGISPIGVNANRTTYLVNRITSRSLSGSTPDYRIRDSHKVTICDFFRDDLGAKTQLQHSGKKIGNDGPPGATPPGPTVVTPKIYKGTINGLIDQYASNDLLQNIDVIKANTIVQPESNPPTRMSARIPLQTIDCLFQFAIAIDQVA